MRRHEKVKEIRKNESGKRRENPSKYIMDSVNKCELSNFRHVPSPPATIPGKYISYLQHYYYSSNIVIQLFH